ncbi:hypothetical protein QEG73_06885 [Chitinophagaceae bacterium 26-R-25]|nr:hypothetical protein [Chitinophagaceae bacterium 26-R-25]
MTKSRIILGALLIGSLLTGTAEAQSKSAQPVSPMRVGSATLNLGIGVGAPYDGHYNGNAFGTKIAAEWGLWQAGPGVITLGGEFGGSFSNKSYYNDHDHWQARTIVLAMRSAWHYGWKVKGLDTYAGLSAGIGFERYGYEDNRENDVIPVFGGFVGASYFFTPGFGVNAEAGYDITNFQVGVVFKLK